MRTQFNMRQRTEFDVLLWILAAVLIIGGVAVAIEWNARRQAAAITRELLRPATPKEQAQVNAMERAAEKEWAGTVAKPRATVRRRSAPQPLPLRQGERCIDHTRMVRVANGWRQTQPDC